MSNLNDNPRETVSPRISPYDFYRNIGCPKLIVAPMVDHSDLPYRLLVRNYNADLVYTQMINANMFNQSSEFRKEIFQTNEKDRPLIVQLAGHEQITLLKAAKFIQDRCDAVDINLGCPQSIAKRGKYGAFLMEDLNLLHDIVSTLVKGLHIPVTCKTRIYKDVNRTIQMCETLVNAGASMLVIHGRTREEKGSNIDKADCLLKSKIRDIIKQVKLHFKERIPIISNGSISSLTDIKNCMEYTGVDGVMTSEAILENPALFVNNVCPKSVLANYEYIEEYLTFCKLYPVSNVRIIRSHLMKFLHKYIIHHKMIRDRLVVAQCLEDFLSICKELKEVVNNTGKSYNDRWYFRHSSPSNQLLEDDSCNQKVSGITSDDFFSYALNIFDED